MSRTYNRALPVSIRGTLPASGKLAPVLDAYIQWRRETGQDLNLMLNSGVAPGRNEDAEPQRVFVAVGYLPINPYNDKAPDDLLVSPDWLLSAPEMAPLLQLVESCGDYIAAAAALEIIDASLGSIHIDYDTYNKQQAERAAAAHAGA